MALQLNLPLHRLIKVTGYTFDGLGLKPPFRTPDEGSVMHLMALY